MKKLFTIDKSEKQRILEMHKTATSRHYLNEQDDNILSSNQMAEIAKRLTNLLVGDVKTKHLEQVHEILKTEVFGKKASESECAYSKVSKYFEGTRAKFFTWGAFVPSDYKKTALYVKINKSEEGSEPQFVDIKKQLMDDINGELNGFCKRLADQSKQSADEEQIKNDFYKKLPCLQDEKFVGIEKGKNTEKNYFKFEKGGLTYAVDYVDLILYVLNNKKWDKKGDATCVEPKGDATTLDESISYVDKEKNEIVALPDSNNQQSTDNNQQSTDKPVTTNTNASNLLKKGSKGEEVLGVKKRIKQKYPNLANEIGLDDSDTYDDKTIAAVATFQAKQGIKVDGIVGPQTREKLALITLEQ